MLQRAFENVRDDLHVGVRMRREAAAAGDAVVVDDAQRAKAHVLLVEVGAEGKAVAAVQPAEVGTAALLGSAKGQHVASPFLGAPEVAGVSRRHISSVDPIALNPPIMNHSGSILATMDKLDAMNAFAKVVAAGSYAEAARRLGLTRSAVSKAVMELEQLLGARLLDRTTRRVTPTEAGLAYYERCVSILADVEETEIQISRLHDEPRGVLKINAPMSFGTMYLGEAVAEFMARYPELRIELVLNDRFIDPLEEGVDVTVRIGALADSSLIARRLAPARLRARRLARLSRRARHTPRRRRTLRNHRCLAYGHMAAVHRWHLHAGRRGRVRCRSPRRCAPTTARCCARRRWPATASPICRRSSSGPTSQRASWCRCCRDNPPTELGIYALYAPNRYLAAKTRVFIDFLVATLRRGAGLGRLPARGTATSGYSSQRGRSERSSVSPDT